MQVIIQLKTGKEIIIDLTQEEYEGLKKLLLGGKVKRIEIENHIISVDAIQEVYISQKDIISKEFRLPEPQFQQVGASKVMEETFNLLKSKGLFKEYENYEEWQKSKRAFYQ